MIYKYILLITFLNEAELIFWYTVNSIYYESFVCIQLNVYTYDI